MKVVPIFAFTACRGSRAKKWVDFNRFLSLYPQTQCATISTSFFKDYMYGGRNEDNIGFACRFA